MTLKEEVPDTEIGLTQYIDYSTKQISESQSRIRMLRNRVKACIAKLYWVNNDKANRSALDHGFRIDVDGDKVVKLIKIK